MKARLLALTGLLVASVLPATAATASPVVVIPTTTQELPYSGWFLTPHLQAFDAVGSWIVITQDPQAQSGQLPPAYAYGHTFAFLGQHPGGFLALTKDSDGKSAILGVYTEDGDLTAVGAPFNWQPGRAYFPVVGVSGTGQVTGKVYDHSTGAWTNVGSLSYPSEWGKLSIQHITWTGWYGVVATACTQYPRTEVYRHAPVGFQGGQATHVGSEVLSGVVDGECATVELPAPSPWVGHRLGG